MTSLHIFLIAMLCLYALEGLSQFLLCAFLSDSNYPREIEMKRWHDALGFIYKAVMVIWIISLLRG